MVTVHGHPSQDSMSCRFGEGSLADLTPTPFFFSLYYLVSHSLLHGLLASSSQTPLSLSLSSQGHQAQSLLRDLDNLYDLHMVPSNSCDQYRRLPMPSPGQLPGRRQYCVHTIGEA